MLCQVASGQQRFDPVEHYLASRRAPKNLRSLPSITRSAIRLARDANSRLFYLSSATQIVVAGLLGLQVLFGKLALEGILEATQEEGSLRPALLPLIGLVAAGALSTFAAAFQTLAQRLLGEHVQRTTLDSMLAVTTAVDLETFESPAFFDELQRVQANALLRPLTMAQGLVGTFGGLVGCVGLTIALLAIEPLLVPILLVSGLPLWIFSRIGGRIEFEFNADQSPGARLRFYLVQVLVGRDEAKELRAFSLGPVLRERWHASYRTYLSDLRDHVRRRALLALGSALAAVLVTIAAFALLLSFVLSDRIGLAEAGAAVLGIRLLSSRIEQVFKGIGSLFESSLFLADLQRFLARKPTVPTGETTPTTMLGPFEELVLEDVRFAYPGADDEALKGVSLSIRAGEVVALVGENGSGKTTLAKLLAALFAPTGGRILWDGRDLATLDRRALRRHIGVIFQDFVRYQLTARENVGFGRAEAMDDLDGIRDAASRAGAGTFVDRLPGRYETLLGKAFAGGWDLSGGQWQRLALARAFFRGAHFLLLDEPTASLDARSENELYEHVQALSQGRSVLLISHRFSTVKAADRIYVLHDGEIVEQGSHDELMALGGRYAELFDLQAAGYR